MCIIRFLRAMVYQAYIARWPGNTDTAFSQNMASQSVKTEEAAALRVVSVVHSYDFPYPVFGILSIVYHEDAT